MYFFASELSNSRVSKMKRQGQVAIIFTLTLRGWFTRNWECGVKASLDDTSKL